MDAAVVMKIQWQGGKVCLEVLFLKFLKKIEGYMQIGYISFIFYKSVAYSLKNKYFVELSIRK